MIFKAVQHFRDIPLKKKTSFPEENTTTNYVYSYPCISGKKYVGGCNYELPLKVSVNEHQDIVGWRENLKSDMIDPK